MFWIIHGTHLALQLTITPDNREYTVGWNRAHTCAPVVHPPALLKTAVYVTPGHVQVMLTYVVCYLNLWAVVHVWCEADRFE